MDKIYGMAITADGSLFLGGLTYGTWASQPAGASDFAIVKLHPDSGTVLWKWQVIFHLERRVKLI